jgi:hypothetical protein
VIEINDNPNIDAGMEDAVLGDSLYRKILDHFLRLYEAPHQEAIADLRVGQPAVAEPAALLSHPATSGSHSTVALGAHG